jgi:hypothetical protein
VRATVASAAFAAVLPFALAAQAPGAQSQPAQAAKSSTYNQVVQGMSCKQQPSGQMDCEYKVGTSVRFIIQGVGQQDVVITFHNVASEGDYLASVAPLHGCVVVQPKSDNNMSSTNLAFVSPQDGKIHRTWNACIKQPPKK